MPVIRKTYKSTFELGSIISTHLAQLEEMFGGGREGRSAFRPQGIAHESFWSSNEHWNSCFAEFIKLTGDTTIKDHISFTDGNGWSVIQGLSNDFKVWRFYFVFDDDIAALTYKLTYSL